MPDDEFDDLSSRRRRPSPSRIREQDAAMVRAGEDSGGWDPVERKRELDQISTAMVSSMRTELKQMRQADHERAIREEALRDAEEVSARESAAEREETEKTEKKAADKRRERLLNGLIVALTTAIATVGTYFATRPAPVPVVEAVEAKAKAEVAEVRAVKAAAAAVSIDERQDQKLEQLGEAAVDQIVLDVDTTDYNARMMKAMSARAAREEEPESLTEARVKASKIKKHRKSAKAKGEHYDPFEDLPKSGR